jgi:predicted GNAT superfamily acetyltransferase
MLKWEQRERILAQGMELINWTYDPLQAPNANFNINRLGVVVGTYLVDLYGSSGSPLHGGIPTDRFEAEWWIGSERVLAAVRGVQPVRSGWEVLPRANRVSPAGPFIRCDGFDDGLDAPEMLVEIPAAISSIMAEDRELALDWRLQSRAIFQRYFGRGYRVVGFHRGEGRAFYRLTVSDPLL